MTNPLPKILLVDDNAINRKLYRHILASLAAEVVEVSSGAEALQAGTHNDFALVVLDCSMPEMDGFETARRLRALSRSSRVPIIFFTAAYTSPAEIREGYKLGAVVTCPLIRWTNRWCERSSCSTWRETDDLKLEVEEIWH